MPGLTLLQLLRNKSAAFRLISFLNALSASEMLNKQWENNFLTSQIVVGNDQCGRPAV